MTTNRLRGGGSDGHAMAACKYAYMPWRRHWWPPTGCFRILHASIALLELIDPVARQENKEKASIGEFDKLPLKMKMRKLIHILAN